MCKGLDFYCIMQYLGLLDPFDGIYFWHALFKVCQYATPDQRLFIGLPLASIKVA